ncbi:hypothetical protein O6H91_Y391700 [Diphasiastrum complanatum]|nr:hypothetical protein O6H91_Y391700 [Diphasiastrum complanatum]
MADDPPPSAAAQAPIPPPFIAFPFPQMRPPPFWQMQDHHTQFFGLRTLPPTVQFALPDLHSHAQLHHFPLPFVAMQSGDGRAAVAPRPSPVAATHFATRNFPPHPGDRLPPLAYSSVSAFSSHNPAAGLQLCTESPPESSLLDPQTSSPPPQSSRQAIAKELPRVDQIAQKEQEYSGAFRAAAPVARRQNVHQAVYPPPLASHQDVVAHRQLFYDTLSKLHAFLGIQSQVPHIGGKDLDLHALYREVTQYGGLKQVIKFNKWKDIIAALELPAQVSSPSFFLRKHYINLLHHYEQVYYLRVQGHFVPPPAPLPAPCSVSTPRIQDISKHATGEDPKPAKRRRRKKFKTIEMLEDDPGQSVGRNVTGAIEGKFEHGYLVTVVVGTQKMRGVLYHVPPGNDTPQFAALPELLNKLGSPQNALDLQVGMRRRRSKNGNYLKRDPNAPRSSRSGYNFFFAEQRTRLKDYHPEKHTDVTKIIGELWHSLTPEERMPYLQRGQTDKERYRQAKTEYQEKLKMQIELRDDNAIQVHSESLDDRGHCPEQLEQSGVNESGDANDSDHDYHVSLDADLDIGAFNLSQEQGLRTQMFGDYVPEVDTEHSQGYHISEHRDQEQRVYAAQPADNEEEEDEEEDDDDDGDEDEDDGNDAQEDGQYASVEASDF